MIKSLTASKVSDIMLHSSFISSWFEWLPQLPGGQSRMRVSQSSHGFLPGVRILPGNHCLAYVLRALSETHYLKASSWTASSVHSPDCWRALLSPLYVAR